MQKLSFCYYCIVQYNNKTITPTTESYAELQEAYSHFNECLFRNELPECLITLQRKKGVYGYFCKERFKNEEGKFVDEIALNPSTFLVGDFNEIMQTLVHEMCHLWQFHFGKPGRGNYHNKEWASMMESIGLMPSSTGKVGGKKTGDSMSDYAIKNGIFLEATNKLVDDGFKISWKDRYTDKKILGFSFDNPLTPSALEIKNHEENGVEFDLVQTPNNSNRSKFNCPSCKSNAWGKPSLNLICGDCSVAFVAIA